MTAFTVEVKDQEVRAALKALAARATNMRPVLQTIGESIIERTKHRFDTSTAPDGTPWKAYPIGGATLAMLTNRIAGSKSNRKKDGSLNSKGSRALAGKKLLVDSNFLRQQIVQSATNASLTVKATAKYAAMQQFGGVTSAKSMIPGKKIPARPFLPIRQDGTLYPDEKAEILNELNAYLMSNL